MTRDERIAARKAMIFPKEKVGHMVIDGPKLSVRYPLMVYSVGMGGFPELACGIRVPWLVTKYEFVYDPFDIYGSRAVSGRLDIGRRMRALIAVLRNFGIEDITHSDISAECEDEWGENYAIACDCYTPYGDGTDSDYFDNDRCVEDFIKYVREFFAADPTAHVGFHNLQYGSNEIEVTRSKPSVG